MTNDPVTYNAGRPRLLACLGAMTLSTAAPPVETQPWVSCWSPISIRSLLRDAGLGLVGAQRVVFEAMSVSPGFNTGPAATAEWTFVLPPSTNRTGIVSLGSLRESDCKSSTGVTIAAAAAWLLLLTGFSLLYLKRGQLRDGWDPAAARFRIATTQSRPLNMGGNKQPLQLRQQASADSGVADWQRAADKGLSVKGSFVGDNRPLHEALSDGSVPYADVRQAPPRKTLSSFGASKTVVPKRKTFTIGD
jgi:hypothetical protein